MPDDGFLYVLRDVWWSCPSIDVESQSLVLNIADVSVWGANQPGEGPGYVWWFWQGRQALAPGDTVSLSLLGEPTILAAWIGTGYKLSEP